MPSPFPGMDPFLEHPHLWPDVHGRLIVTVAEILQPKIAPRYFAQIEERLFLANSRDSAAQFIVADVRVREADTPGFINPSNSSTAASTAVIEPGIDLAVEWASEVRETRVEIRDLQQNRVITIIEILSPANKTAGSAGRESYLQKRQEAISAGCNFVEIDLLRAGEPLYAVTNALD